MDTKQQEKVVEAEVVEETGMARRSQAPPSFFQLATAGAKDPVEGIEHYTIILGRLKMAALSLTGPQHWVRMGEGDAEFAYPKQGAADTLGLFYGVNVDYPRDARGNLALERFDVEGKPGVYGYRLSATGRSERLERVAPVVATRRNDEEFAGRKDAPRGTKGADYMNAPALDGDLRSAVQRLAKKKATMEVCGCGTVSLSELKEAWLTQSGKKIEMIAKGAGHGSRDDRAAAAVATEDVKLEQEILYRAIGRACGGDESACEQLCADITKFTTGEGKEVAGYREPNRITNAKRFPFVWKAFETHPTFGKLCPNAAERAKIKAEILAEAAGGAK